MHTKISIIIPSYNRNNQIFKALDLLYPMANEENAEIVLVDQTGYDKTRLKEYSNKCRLKYIKRNKPNLPAARNAGAEAASGEILLFIDDDAEPETGWIKNHLSAYKHSDIACVGGSVKDKNAKGILTHPINYNNINGEYIADFGCSTAQETVSCPGGNFSVRKEIWEKIRFDESYKANAYFEEVDFCFRLRKAGWKIYYEPAAAVVHKSMQEGGCHIKSYSEVYYRFRNYSLFYFRFSKAANCIHFYRKEKNYAEYISRKTNGGHKISVVLMAMTGSFIGTKLGLCKRLKDKLGLLKR